MNILTKFVKKIKWNVQRKQRPLNLFEALDYSLAYGYHSVNWSKVGL